MHWPVLQIHVQGRALDFRQNFNFGYCCCSVYGVFSEKATSQSLVKLDFFACRVQPRSQHCLSTALAQAVSFFTLIGFNLNNESVRKILKTQLRYEVSYGLQLQSTKDQETVLQFTQKQLLDNEMFLNLH